LPKTRKPTFSVIGRRTGRLSAARYVTGTRRAYGGLGTGHLVEDVPGPDRGHARAMATCLPTSIAF